MGCWVKIIVGYSLFCFDGRVGRDTKEIILCWFGRRELSESVEVIIGCCAIVSVDSRTVGESLSIVFLIGFVCVFVFEHSPSIGISQGEFGRSHDWFCWRTENRRDILPKLFLKTLSLFGSPDNTCLLRF